MIDYLTHYYSADKGPFQSLSALPDEEAAMNKYLPHLEAR
jgi:hypothetical protein